MQKDSVVSLSILKPVYGGYHLAKLNGKTVFVEGVLPDEQVSAIITKQNKDYLFATPIAFHQTSPHRRSPLCEYFGICGGCQLQYVSGHYQRELKKQVLKETLLRQAGIDLQVTAEFSSPKEFHYKHKAQLKVKQGQIGFYKAGTNDLVPIKHCKTAVQGINSILDTLPQALKDIELADCTITASFDEAVMSLRLKEARINRSELTQRLLDLKLSGIIIQHANRVDVYQSPSVTLPLLNFKYQVSAETFFQTNWEVNLRLLQYLCDLTKDCKDLSLLDLYAGAGNFSLALSGNFKKVVAVECVQTSLKDLKDNIVVNQIANIEVHPCRVEDFKAKERFDVLLVDPPRLGLTSKAIDTLLALKAPNLIYISCNPSTLARDLKRLNKAYIPTRLLHIDFFPQTFHIESAVFLKLK